MPRCFRFLQLILLLSLPLLACAEPRTKLVQVLVLDQFPQYYLEMYRSALCDSGLVRLMNGGAVFDQADLGYGSSETGPGHATIATGCMPSEHGIVANSWLERSTHRTCYCVEDARYPLIDSLETGRRKGISPLRTLRPGIGDAIKAAGLKSKAWTVSLKDRAAVGLGGQHADGALWWSEQTGHFMSSRYYFPRLPDWLTQYNKTEPANRYFKTIWDRLLPEAAYAVCSADDVAWEKGRNAQLSNTFPKIIGADKAAPDQEYYGTLGCTPFGNDLIFETARRAVLAESLGMRGATDYLGISLSSVDEAGHIFGPRSHETMDILARADRAIADWLKFLDANIGLDHCVIAVTSDHGSGFAPESVGDSITDKGRYRWKAMRDSLNTAVRRHVAASDSLQFIARLDLPWIYLNDSLLTARSIPADSAIQWLIAAAQAMPQVQQAFPARILLDSTAHLDPLRIKAKNCFLADRVGEVYVHLKPYWEEAGDCTGHGTANASNTHVPLILFGSGILPGRYSRPVEVRDLAPTVCAAAGIPVPAEMSGRILREALTR